ncbi:hypothetical protein J6A31_02605 [bacterium]|nr:hypothetical protein [bacterium]
MTKKQLMLIKHVFTFIFLAGVTYGLIAILDGEFFYGTIISSVFIIMEFIFSLAYVNSLKNNELKSYMSRGNMLSSFSCGCDCSSFEATSGHIVAYQNGFTYESNGIEYISFIKYFDIISVEHKPDGLIVMASDAINSKMFNFKPIDNPLDTVQNFLLSKK